MAYFGAADTNQRAPMEPNPNSIARKMGRDTNPHPNPVPSPRVDSYPAVYAPSNPNPDPSLRDDSLPRWGFDCDLLNQASIRAISRGIDSNHAVTRGSVSSRDALGTDRPCPVLANFTPGPPPIQRIALLAGVPRRPAVKLQGWSKSRA
jgi:hypothetical protein